jgi:hypothetical protein
MSNIYLINELEEFLINLNFRTNTFFIKNLEYKFDLFEKNKIKIYWTENNIEIYYTEDSYLFFSDFKFKNLFLNINLIHSEWYDQAFINYRNNHLVRINNKEQYGTFYIEDNYLIIDWNFWGKERFKKYDYNTFIQENYEKIILNKENDDIFDNINIPIHVFIHICAIENWRVIFEELIECIKSSGLYLLVSKIHLGILGDFSVLQDDIFKDDKFNILYYDKNKFMFETQTINHIKFFCENEEEEKEKEIYILYLHTKGVRRAGNEEVIKSWRQMMEYFLINKYNDCLKNLTYYNTLGNNLINSFIFEKEKVSVSDKHTMHYSGNFWWSKKSYIKTLPFLDLDLTKNSYESRFKCENWILSNYEKNDLNFGLIYQDFTNPHPYHKFIFDNYKKNNFLIKNIKY